MLARLLTEPGQVVTRERLYDALWGEDLPDAARKAIHVYVSNLRRVLADVPGVEIETSPGGYVLRVEPDHVDLHVFRTLAARDDSAAALDEALALWRGDPYGGLGDSPLRVSEGPRLTEERLAVVEARAGLAIAAGEPGTAIPMLYDVIAAHPLREPAHGWLMRALLAAGRLGEGLAVFRDVRRLLREQLGTEPSAELAAVHRELLAAERPATTEPAAVALPDPSQPAQPAQPAHPAQPRPAQLPAESPHFVGRAAEVADLTDALTARGRGVATVAVTGYGGIGKSALALHVAHAVADRFDGGQLYADLRGAHPTPATASDVLAGFLHAYGLDGDRLPVRLADRAALFRSVTAGRPILVVLDDAASAEQVAPIVPGTAGSAVIVTARRRLAGLDGVRTVRLSELPVTDAVGVLARYVGAEPAPADQVAAERIARWCSGVPLALRIAGGRLEARAAGHGWSLDAFADQLESQPPLAALYDGDLEVRATFEATYRLLNAEAARLFRLLAVTGVPEPVAPAIAVASGTSAPALNRLLDDLVDLHLLEEPAPGRYRYHDLLRSFAIERSAEEDAAADRHRVIGRAFAYYASATVAALNALLPGMRFADPIDPPDGMVPAHFDSAESATAWLAGEHVAVTELARLAVETDPATALGPAAELAVYLGNYAEIAGYWAAWEELARSAFDAARHRGDRPVERRIRIVLVGAAGRRGEDAVAVQYAEPVLRDAATRGDRLTEGRLNAMLGVAHFEARHYDEAEDRVRRALVAYRAAEWPRGYVGAVIHLAEVAGRRSEHRVAARRARAALRLESAAGLDEPYLRMNALVTLGDALAGLGDRDAAERRYRDALELATEYDSPTIRRLLQTRLDRMS